MKCLSIRQPWAWAIAHGIKIDENRVWKAPPAYRGLVAIHASKFQHAVYHRDAMEFICANSNAFYQQMRDLSYGAIIGVAMLKNAATIERMPLDVRTPFTEGPVVLRFAGAVPIEPLPFKAQLGLFGLPQDVVDLVTKRMNEKSVATNNPGDAGSERK